jgi:hypothetical protein
VGDTSKGEKEGVTEAGFRFLLTTAREQIWLLLTQYISSYVTQPGGGGGGGASAVGLCTLNQVDR